jgi:hypothetical protein
MVVDDAGRVITSVDVSTGTADDTTALDSLLQGHIIRSRGRPRQLVGDSHYGTSEAYRYLAGEGVEAVISPRRSKNRPGFLRAGDFKYDKETDCYICPEGKELKFKAHQRTVHRKAYVADKETCDRCRIRAKCTTARLHGRMITKFMDDHFEQAEQRVQSTDGKRLLRQRQTVIEGVFGEAKTFHLLQRALFRGKTKVKIQLLMTAAVLNLKRLFKRGINRQNIARPAFGTM